MLKKCWRPEPGPDMETSSRPSPPVSSKMGLLVLAVLVYCPLESGGSQLERGASGDALSPLCGKRETHRGLERLSAGAWRKSKRKRTWGAWSFQPGFLRGPFSTWGHLLSDGQIYWRYTKLEGGKEPTDGTFPVLTVRDISVADTDCQNK